MADDNDINRIGRRQAHERTPPEAPQPAGFVGAGSPVPEAKKRRPARHRIGLGEIASLAVMLGAAITAGAYYLGTRHAGHQSATRTVPTSAPASAPAAVPTTNATANADGCREFDEAFALMHQAIGERTALTMQLGALEIADGVPDAAEKTTGATRQAMLNVATAGQLLAKKEAVSQSTNWSDHNEISAFQTAYGHAQELCRQAGVALVNTPYAN